MSKIPINEKQTNILIWAAVIVVLFVLFGAGKRILLVWDSFLETIGVKDTKEEIELDKDIKESASIKSAFSPSFAADLQKQTGKPVYILTRADQDKFAKRIYESVGYLFDTPEQALSAFKSMRYKSQVSSLAGAFARLYKVDLLGWLYEKFDTDSQKAVLSQIIAYVDSLPKGNA